MCPKPDSNISLSMCLCAAEFQDKYVQLGKLGEGGFGSVYEGLRKTDMLPVSLTLTFSLTSIHRHISNLFFKRIESDMHVFLSCRLQLNIFPKSLSRPHGK